MQLIPIPNIPLIQPEDNLAAILRRALLQADLTLAEDDIVVIAQKVISKAENCFVDVTTVTPSAQALELAEITGKPAPLIEIILWDTAEIIRARKGLLIVQHRLGFISANAGVDHSNVSHNPNLLLRLPHDPDASAQAIRQAFQADFGIAPPVLIIDSHGRPWRFGTVGVTIGLSGLRPVLDLRGQPDLFGRPLAYTDVGFADQIAAAATLLMGQATESCPVVIVRGLPFTRDDQARAADGLRPKTKDLFR